MALLDSIRNVFENIIPTADADVTKNYQITFTVQGTGDWDGLHTLNIPVKGKYTNEKAILAIRRANGVERSAKVTINNVKEAR